MIITAKTILGTYARISLKVLHLGQNYLKNPLCTTLTKIGTNKNSEMLCNTMRERERDYCCSTVVMLEIHGLNKCTVSNNRHLPKNWKNNFFLHFEDITAKAPAMTAKTCRTQNTQKKTAPNFCSSVCNVRT